MNRRLAELAAVVALAMFLLAATQVWVVAVVEPAAGAPRVLVEAVGGTTSPWGPAGALVALAAGALSASRGRGWTRLVLVTGAAAALAAALRAATDPASVSAAGTLVSTDVTSWAWVAVFAAGLAVTTAVLSLLLREGMPRARRPVPDTAAERARRRSAEQWRSLSEGHDPTGGA